MANRRIQELFVLMQKNLECSICLEMMTKPVSTKCGHQFCNFCLLEFLKTKRQVPCPLCKQPITKRSLTERPHLGEMVTNVRSLINAFQNDTGEIFSPPSGSHLLNFVSCTPEHIKAKPSNNNRRQSSKVEGRDPGRRGSNVRHSRRLAVNSENLSPVMPLSQSQSRLPSTVQPSENENLQNSETSPAQVESRTRSRSKTRESAANVKGHSTSVSKVNSQGQCSKPGSPQEKVRTLQNELIHIIETGHHGQKRHSSPTSTVDTGLVKTGHSIGQLGGHEVSARVEGDLSRVVDTELDIDDKTSLQDNNMDIPLSLGTSVESNDCDHASLFQTPCPIDSVAIKQKISSETVVSTTRQTRSRSHDRTSDRETGTQLMLTPDSVDSTVHSFCNSKDIEKISKVHRNYSRTQVNDKAIEMKRKVSNWFKTFPDQTEAVSMETSKQASKSKQGRKSQRHRGIKNLNDAEFGNKMKSLASKLITNVASDFLFGFGESSPPPKSDISESNIPKIDNGSLVNNNSENISNLTTENAQEQTILHEESIVSPAELNTRVDMQTSMSPDKLNLGDVKESCLIEGTASIQNVSEKQSTPGVTEQSISGLVEEVKELTKSAELVSLSNTKKVTQSGRADFFKEPYKPVVAQRKKIFKSKSASQVVHVSKTSSSQLAAEDSSTVREQKSDNRQINDAVSTEIPSISETKEDVTDDASSLPVSHRPKATSTLQERLAALENDSPGSDPYEFKSSQNTPVKVKRKQRTGTGNHQQRSKKAKVSKNPIDIYIGSAEASKDRPLVTGSHKTSPNLADCSKLTKTTKHLKSCLVTARSEAEISKLSEKINAAEDYDLLTCSQDAVNSLERERKVGGHTAGADRLDLNCARQELASSSSTRKHVRFQEPVLTNFVSPEKIDFLGYRKAKEEYEKLHHRTTIQGTSSYTFSNTEVMLTSVRKDSMCDAASGSPAGNSPRKSCANKSPNAIINKSAEISPEMTRKTVEKSPGRNPMWTPSMCKSEDRKQDGESTDSDTDTSGTDDLDIEPDLDQYAPPDLDIQPEAVKKELSQNDFMQPLLMTPKPVCQLGFLKGKSAMLQPALTVVEETPVIYQQKTNVEETPVIYQQQMKAEETPSLFSDTLSGQTQPQPFESESIGSLTQSPLTNNTAVIELLEDTDSQNCAITSKLQESGSRKPDQSHCSDSTQESESILLPNLKTTVSIDTEQNSGQENSTDVSDELMNTDTDHVIISSGSSDGRTKIPVRKPKRKCFMLGDGDGNSEVRMSPDVSPSEATPSSTAVYLGEDVVMDLDKEKDDQPKKRLKRMRKIGSDLRDSLPGEKISSSDSTNTVDNVKHSSSEAVDNVYCASQTVNKKSRFFKNSESTKKESMKMGSPTVPLRGKQPTGIVTSMADKSPVTLKQKFLQSPGTDLNVLRSSISNREIQTSLNSLQNSSERFSVKDQMVVDVDSHIQTLHRHASGQENKMLVPETCEEPMVLTPEKSVEMVPESMNFIDSQSQDSQPSETILQSDRITGKIDKAKSTLRPHDQFVLSSDIISQEDAQNLTSERMRHSSGMLISPEEIEDEDVSTSPTNICQQNSEMPAVSYSPLEQEHLSESQGSEVISSSRREDDSVAEKDFEEEDEEAGSVDDKGSDTEMPVLERPLTDESSDEYTDDDLDSLPDLPELTRTVSQEPVECNIRDSFPEVTDQCQSEGEGGSLDEMVDKHSLKDAIVCSSSSEGTLEQSQSVCSQEDQSVLVLTSTEIQHGDKTSRNNQEVGSYDPDSAAACSSLSCRLVPESVPKYSDSESDGEMDDGNDLTLDCDIEKNGEKQTPLERQTDCKDKTGKVNADTTGDGEDSMNSVLDLDPTDVVKCHSDKNMDASFEHIGTSFLLPGLDLDEGTLAEVNDDQDTMEHFDKEMSDAGSDTMDAKTGAGSVVEILESDLEEEDADEDTDKDMESVHEQQDNLDLNDGIDLKDDIEDDSIDEPVKHRRPPRKAVILDSSDDDEGDDSSQDSRHLNLTSSSAFSSQSETLGSQERLALEKDLERMSREMAEIKAQLKRKSNSGGNTSKSSTPNLKSLMSRNKETEDTCESKETESLPKRRHRSLPLVIDDSDNDEEEEEDKEEEEIYNIEEEEDCIEEDNSSEENDYLYLSPPPPSPLSSLPREDSTANTNLPEDILEVTRLLDEVKGQISGNHTDNRKKTHADSMSVSRGLREIDVNKPARSPRDRTVIVKGLLATGLTTAQLFELRKLAALNDCKVFSKFNSTVSHVVVRPATEDDSYCDRTLKFFQGVAGKCWVVSFLWVSDSRQAGYLLPEAPYEIKGDTTTAETHYGPRKSRLSESQLLEKFVFTCLGTSPNLSSDDMTGLLETCSALVREPKHMAGTNRIALAVSCKDYDEEEEGNQFSEEEQTEFTELYRRYRLVTVSREWVLDSLTTFTLLPLQEYLLTPGDNIKVPVF